MMTAAEFEKSLRAFLACKPFQPFLIDFDDGRQFVVGQPAALWYQEGGSALYVGPDADLDFVDCVAVRAFIPLVPAPSAPA
jgi:hypothetical protein